jgi:hypothetical protein
MRSETQVKCPLLLPDFSKNEHVCIFNTALISNFMKIRQITEAKVALMAILGGRVSK